MYKVRLGVGSGVINTIIPDYVGVTDLIHLLRDSKVYHLNSIEIIDDYGSFADVIANLKKELKPRGMVFGKKEETK